MHAAPWASGKVTEKVAELGTLAELQACWLLGVPALGRGQGAACETSVPVAETVIGPCWGAH